MATRTILAFLLYLLLSGALTLAVTTSEDGTTEPDLKSQILKSGIKYLPPGPHMDRLVRKRKLKKGATPGVQVVDGSSVKIGDTDYPLDKEHLVEMNVLTQDARHQVDGKEQPTPPSVWQHTWDSTLLMTFQSDKTFQSAIKVGEEDVEEIEGTGVFVNVKLSDLDKDSLEELYPKSTDIDEDDDLQVPPSLDLKATGEARNLRDQLEPGIAMIQETMLTTRTLEQAAGTSANSPDDSISRRLVHQKDCGGDYHVIKMSIVVDSYVCERHNGDGSRAAADAITVVQEASMRFRKFCCKLEIVELFVYCDKTTDPIRPLIDGASSACSGTMGLIQQFRAKIAVDLNGDLRHLFHGYDFPGSSVGCAYSNAICHKVGSIRSAINQMTFSNWPDSKANLLAHEVGHGLGCPHVSSRQDIMFPTIHRTCDEFAGNSSLIVQKKLASVHCTSKERSVLLAKDNFERRRFKGGLFTKRGRYARIRKRFAYDGAYALHLRYNSTLAMVETLQNFTFHAGTRFRLSFHYFGRRMQAENGDRFAVQVKNYSPHHYHHHQHHPNTWTILRTFNIGNHDFPTNEVWYPAVIESQTFLKTNSGVKFRIIAIIQGRTRKILIDDFKIERRDLV